MHDLVELRGRLAKARPGEFVAVDKDDLPHLALIGQPWRTVLANGCFDVLHPGHINHLREAKALGDELIVSVTADRYVNKGPGRPVFTQEERSDAIRALSFVDGVLINDAANAVPVIEKVKPAIYVKGVDYNGKQNDPNLDLEIEATQKVGGSFYTTKAAKSSSTRILTGYRMPQAVIDYLGRAKAHGFRDKLLAAFERADKLKIAFVGEEIIDEYRYVKSLSRPSKEFILATVEARKADVFHGGIVAASRQGEWPRSYVVSIADPIKKSRYVDADFSRKLFEVYSKERIAPPELERERFNVRLIEAVRDADVVVVIDFGHGLMDAKARHIVEGAKFLAVNAQTNAANHGFNMVTKYERAHYICVDEPEARLASGRQYDPVNEVYEWFPGNSELIITRGRHGSRVYDIDVPALATNALDTIGAGDTFLAVTAPLIAAGLEVEPAAFVGNVAGAIKTEIVGHQRHVTRKELMDRIEGLLE